MRVAVYPIEFPTLIEAHAIVTISLSALRYFVIVFPIDEDEPEPRPPIRRRCPDCRTTDMTIAHDGIAGRLYVCPTCGVTLMVPPRSHPGLV
jgi:hypothetical protein